MSLGVVGQVHVFYKKMFDERWGVVNLPGRLHAADFTIAHVDISRNAAGTVVIAAAGTFSHIGPAICLFELGIDLTKGCTSLFFFFFSCGLNLPVSHVCVCVCVCVCASLKRARHG